MKTILIFLQLLIGVIAFAQQVHVKYLHVRSQVVTIYENLYINKFGNVISVQDSLSPKTNLSANAIENLSSDQFYFISDIEKDSRTFYYNDILKDQTYFIADKDVPKPEWKIDKTKTKKILGYTCYKAETVFRGRPFTAYYTEELPYSAGPYKFFGLPGLILEVRASGKDYFLWKADYINANDNTKLDFKPSLKSQPKITIKEFVALKDEEVREFRKKVTQDLPPGITQDSPLPGERLGIEKVYEWEK